MEPPKPKRGRPKTPDPKIPVTTWITPRAYDRLASRARQLDRSLSGLLADLVTPPRRPPR
jgi:hypothetical protein